MGYSLAAKIKPGDFTKLEYSRNGMNRNFMSFPVHFLDGRVVGVFVRYEESRLNVAPIRVLPLAIEHLLVQFDVVVVNGVVERDSDHLGHVLEGKIARDQCAVLGAEAVREDTDSGVARGCTVRVVVIVWNS